MLQSRLVLMDKMSACQCLQCVCVPVRGAGALAPRGAGALFGSRGLFSLIARRERHQRGIEPPWAGY